MGVLRDMVWGEPRQTGVGKRPEDLQVYQRRERLKHNLEQPKRGQQDATEPAVATQRVAVFPQTLESAERPAETLAEQPRQCCGHLGEAQRLIIRFHTPAGPSHPPREVRIFWKRAFPITANLEDRLSPPRSDRARHHRPGI